MTKGRRAADRRRERSSGDGVAFDDVDATGTTPVAAPASPHDDYVEVDDDSRLDASALPSAEIESLHDGASASRPRPSGGATGARPQPRPGDDDHVDPERALARELKKRPREDTAAAVRVEVTVIKERKARPPKRGARLVVVAVDGVAPAAPIELSIAVVPALLGRTAGADVRLTDPTVSLRHAELSWDDGDDGDDGAGRAPVFAIADLGSASGTLVNGMPIDQRTALAHGDIVAVGKTELRFVRAAAAPVPRAPTVEEPALEPTEAQPAPPERTSTEMRVAREVAAEAQREADREARRRAEDAAAALRRKVRRRAGWVIAACAAVAFVVVVGRFVHREALSDEAPAQVRLQVATLLAEAREHLLQGDVDGAAARVGALLALAPGDEEGRSLDRTVTTEKSARDALQLALRLGDEDRDDEALEALLRIADTSVFAKDRDRLRGALAERALVRSLRIIESLLADGRFEDALARVAAHLKRFPEDKAGLALRARIEAAKAGAPADDALGPARAAFAAGQLDDARRIAGSGGFAGYVRDVDRFQRALDDGKAALARFDGARARAPLDEAFRLLASLGGGPSSAIFATVQRPYADALYLSGTEKVEKGDGCGGARDLLKAMRVLPNDSRFLAEQQRLVARADQGLVRARGARLEDPDRARSLAREALCFATSGSKTWDELSALAR